VNSCLFVEIYYFNYDDILFITNIKLSLINNKYELHDYIYFGQFEHFFLIFLNYLKLFELFQTFTKLEKNRLTQELDPIRPIDPSDQ
jgi:hypothetical protein